MARDQQIAGISARAMLAIQTGQDTPEGSPTASIDVGSFMLDVVTNQKLNVDIGEIVTLGHIIRTMDGASNINVTLHDSQRAILRSGLLSKTIDLVLNTRQFRLAQNQKQGSDLPLTFEDKIIAQLRDKNDTRTASRGKMTRAQFIRMLVKSVKSDPIRFYCPELDKRQSIAKPKHPSVTKAKKHPGLEKSTNLKVDGHIATKEQVDNAELILNAGYGLNANQKVMISGIMTAEDESNLRNVHHGDTAGPDSTGLFQQRASWGPRADRQDPTKSAKLYFKAAIAIDKANPNLKLWELVTAVQFPAYRSTASGSFPSFGTRYDKFKNEAKEFIKEYGAQGGDTSVTRRQQYQFTVGPPDGPIGENYWEAITRLASDVRWRAFVSNNTFYYCSDDFLINQKPRYTISEESPGVETIDFDVDKGKVNDECTVVCRAARWTAPAGCVVVLEDCGPADGKWLVWEIDRNIFSYDATITLHRKQKKKKETAPDVISVASDGSSEGVVVGGRIVSSVKIRDRIVQAARRALKDAKLYAPYSHWRPESGHKWPSLFSKATHDHGMDCSAFVEMVYMAAGAQDPSGLDYFGGGNTTSQIANGTKVSGAHVQPGDLAFYNRPDHVAIWVGDGQVIGAGSNPTPHISDVNSHPGFIGFYSYTLAKHVHNPDPNAPPAGNPGRL